MVEVVDGICRDCARTGVLIGITSIDVGTRDVTVRVVRSTITVTSVIGRIIVLRTSPRGRHSIVEDYTGIRGWQFCQKF